MKMYPTTRLPNYVHLRGQRFEFEGKIVNVFSYFSHDLDSALNIPHVGFCVIYTYLDTVEGDLDVFWGVSAVFLDCRGIVKGSCG